LVAIPGDGRNSGEKKITSFSFIYSLHRRGVFTQCDVNTFRISEDPSFLHTAIYICIYIYMYLYSTGVCMCTYIRLYVDRTCFLYYFYYSYILQPAHVKTRPVLGVTWRYALATESLYKQCGDGPQWFPVLSFNQHRKTIRHGEHYIIIIYTYNVSRSSSARILCYVYIIILVYNICNHII